MTELEKTERRAKGHSMSRQGVFNWPGRNDLLGIGGDESLDLVVLVGAGGRGAAYAFEFGAASDRANRADAQPQLLDGLESHRGRREADLDGHALSRSEFLVPLIQRHVTCRYAQPRTIHAMV